MNMYCCCCCIFAVAAIAISFADVDILCTAEKVFERGGLFTNKKHNVGFFMSPTWLDEAESNPLLLRANSATFNAPRTATVLGRNRGMHRNVPTASLLAPQPKVRERTLGLRRGACLK